MNCVAMVDAMQIKGYWAISIAHYYVQNGEMMRDPDARPRFMKTIGTCGQAKRRGELLSVRRIASLLFQNAQVCSELLPGRPV
jgi:hypothetical protein